MTYKIVSPGVHGGPGDGHRTAEGAAPAELRGAADTRGLHRRRVLLRGHVGQVSSGALYTRVTCSGGVTCHRGMILPIILPPSWEQCSSSLISSVHQDHNY